MSNKKKCFSCDEFVDADTLKEIDDEMECPECYEYTQERHSDSWHDDWESHEFGDK